MARIVLPLKRPFILVQTRIILPLKCPFTLIQRREIKTLGNISSHDGGGSKNGT